MPLEILKRLYLKCCWEKRRRLRRLNKIDLNKVKRILIIKKYGIGNMILFTPTLKNLRNRFPKARITLYAEKPAVEILEGTNHCDNPRIYPDDFFDKREGKYCYYTVRKLQKEKYDLILISYPTSSSGLLPLLCFSGAGLIIGHNIENNENLYDITLFYDKNRHEVEANLDLLRALNIEVEDKNLDISLRDEELKYSQDFCLRNKLLDSLVIGMHAGLASHQRYKMWAVEKYAELADKLIENYNAAILFFGGEEEHSLIAKIQSMMKHRLLNMAGRTSIRETAALIYKCDLFICGDTGLMHIAGALEVPAIAIFGPTNYRRVGPWGNPERNVIVRKELDCSPCYPIYGPIKECRNKVCLDSITVEDVLIIVKNMKEKLLKKTLHQ